MVIYSSSAGLNPAQPPFPDVCIHQRFEYQARKMTCTKIHLSANLSKIRRYISLAKEGNRSLPENPGSFVSEVRAWPMGT